MRTVVEGGQVERVVLCIVNVFNESNLSEHCLVFGTVKQLCGLCTAKT